MVRNDIGSETREFFGGDRERACSWDNVFCVTLNSGERQIAWPVVFRVGLAVEVENEGNLLRGGCSLVGRIVESQLAK